ncbi:calpain-A-like [Gigantopelta aegis]|uniref:calpain-A-like n=1 Tax=Gigantopelta aegis TaxID=1735272 RepID=UPI001B887CDF|nr:calpain-A-like [Gigantopelta aegis]
MGSVCNGTSSRKENDCNGKINANSDNPFGNVSYNGRATTYRSSSKGSNQQKRSNKNVNRSNIGEDNEDQPFIPTSKEDIDKILSALGPGELFCDPDFPADNRALNFSAEGPKTIRWLRPKEILRYGEPQMMVDGLTRDDIKQGQLGDCWFLSSCAAISQQEKSIKKVVPRGQVLCGPHYKGIVWFSFWRFGKWVDVFIDDQLPTVNGDLIYAHCTEPKEFWVALIEKAYAKSHGSYQGLEGGQPMDAMVDLTGGLTERYDLSPNMYRLISRAHKSGAFIACSKKGNWRNSVAADNGLVSGHAYTITDVKKIYVQDMGEVKLVRIRNPWGDAIEWKGAWADDDDNWNRVDEETKQALGLEARDDGEFWMAFKDFCHHFEEITLCLMGPDFDGDGVSDHAGYMEMVTGSWEVGKTAGGSRNDLSLFSTNPQYLLSLSDPDNFNPSTDDAESEGMCNIVIALMQEHHKSRHNVGAERLQIAFVLYKTNNPTRRLDLKHFESNNDCGKSGTYINFREVSSRLDLNPGHYVIIPSAFKPNTHARFMIRVFGEKRFSLEELLE